MSELSPAPFQIIRKLLPYTTAAACLAVLYIGWVFFSRWNQNRELQHAAEEKSIEQARKTYEMYGSGQLKILLFYASPGVIARGGTTQLCYSVSNAASVKIDNGVEDIKPSLSRCLPVKPAHTTTYTITAADDGGHKATQSVTVVIR